MEILDAISIIISGMYVLAVGHGTHPRRSEGKTIHRTLHLFGKENYQKFYSPPNGDGALSKHWTGPQEDANCSRRHRIPGGKALATESAFFDGNLIQKNHSSGMSISQKSFRDTKFCVKKKQVSEFIKDQLREAGAEFIDGIGDAPPVFDARYDQHKWGLMRPTIKEGAKNRFRTKREPSNQRP